MRLEIKLFGRMQIMDAAGSAAPLLRQRAARLLVYLLLHRRAPLRRDQAAFVLWPDTSEEESLATLRRALSDLRAALPAWKEGEWVLVSPREIGWNNLSPYQVDIDEFERLARQGTPNSLHAAAALYSGDMLPELDDEWVLVERERLRQIHLNSLHRLVIHHREMREHSQAIELAQAALALDPLAENIHRELIAMRYEAGDRAGALAAYERLRAGLWDELGVKPMPETQSLAQTITRGEHLSAEPAATPIQSSLKSNPGTGNPPPLGCDREAELLSNCWDDAARGRGSLVVLSGDAGVGKGNLIRWVKDQVTHSGSLVLDGACYQFERTLPYQPIIEMLRTAAGALQHTGLLPAYRALVARLVPEILETAGLAGSDTELLSGDLRIQLYEAMLQAFLSLARETPLLLAFEHVHWASESTLDWLTYSAPRLAHSRILVLITCRTSEIGADHALRRLEGRFTRDGLVRSLSLHPFNRETTRAWIARESNLTGPRLEQVADCLFQETGGNLFYLQELVCGLQEAGQIVTGSREWSGRFVDETPCTEAFIPESLRSAILARVARLPDRPRKILKTAAVAGDPFLYDVVRDAEGWSDDDALDALEEIIQRGFIREGGRPGVYGFTHHLVEEALYADMSLLRRAHRHRAVAQAIQARHPHDDEALAYHFERAGEVDQARQFHLRAAEHALELGSSIDASDHYRAALRLWPAGDPAGRSEIAARLGVP